MLSAAVVIGALGVNQWMDFDLAWYEVPCVNVFLSSPLAVSKT